MERTTSAGHTNVERSGRYRAPGCPSCGPVEVFPVFDGELTNYYCPLCGACWHYGPGSVTPVQPETCPGCQVELVCRARRHEQARCQAG